MIEQETREKIKKVLDETIRWEPYYYIFRGIVYEGDLDNIADALIAEGLRFGESYAHTATFNMAQLDRINELERRLAEAEHRADKAERALYIFAENMIYSIRESNGELVHYCRGIDTEKCIECNRDCRRGEEAEKMIVECLVAESLKRVEKDLKGK